MPHLLRLPARRAAQLAIVATLAGLAACQHRPRDAVDFEPSAEVSGEALATARAFLDAARRQDIPRFSSLWGTAERSIQSLREKDRSWDLRTDAVLCVLQHDSATVTARAPRHIGESRFDVLLYNHGRRVATTMSVVATNQGSWRVDQIDAAPLTDFCRGSERR